MLFTDSAQEGHHIVVVLMMHGLIQQRRLARDIAGEDRKGGLRTDPAHKRRGFYCDKLVGRSLSCIIAQLESPSFGSRLSFERYSLSYLSPLLLSRDLIACAYKLLPKWRRRKIRRRVERKQIRLIT